MKIGVFDSGYGGLTVLKELVKSLPQYDYLYLGDNARAPYGSRTFETVYQYTLDCVKKLFKRDCQLVILACNTASAKALRTIQQHDLPLIAPQNKVLGVIRPTAERIGAYTQTRHIGILGTSGTVNSQSYLLEIRKFFPDIQVFQEACPMWVPLIENNEIDNEGTAFFIRRHIMHLLAQSPQIDAIILGCTHYPLLMKQIQRYLPKHIELLAQGEIIAESLKNYLILHPEIEENCSKNGSLEFLTTGGAEIFSADAKLFFGQEIVAKHLSIRNG
ncbi:MAG: glutamate racemase [Bacteroidia bacterium]